MADILRINGLVAAGVDPAAARQVQELQAARRAGAMAGAADARAPGDRVEVRPAAELDLDPREAELFQQAVAERSGRAESLERLGAALAALRAGRPGAAAEVGSAAGGPPGPELAALLARTEGSGAAALTPGVVESALVETENALAAVYGELAAGRRALAERLVAVENRSAARTEPERLERAAEHLRSQEREDDRPVAILAALRGPALDRTRVTELLLP
jgi:hypothetical protein